jgi:LPXTG-motif cell wall-anchored protein
MIYEPDAMFEASSKGPAVTFGAASHAEAQLEAQKDFVHKFNHWPAENATEALWLSERTAELKRRAGTSHVTPGSNNLPLMLGVTGALGLGAFLFLRKRRSNPRRTKLTPLLVVGGVGAFLWWNGAKVMESLQARLRPTQPEN